MSTIDQETAREAVLRAADRVFYEHGVARAGMLEIRDAAGVSLRRLYALYPSKAELVAAWLTNRHSTWMAWFAEAIERRAARGVEPLLAAFDAIAEWSRAPGYRGCAFLNTAAELGEIDDTHRTIIARHERELSEYLAALARAGRYKVPRRLAAGISVLVDGAIVQAAVLRSEAPVRAARAAATQLLEAAR